MVNKELTGVLNFEQKQDERKIKAKAEAANFGLNHLGAKSHFELGRQALYHWQAPQYAPFILMLDSFDHLDQGLGLLLSMLSEYPYGLKIGDIARLNNGMHRERIESIEDELVPEYAEHTKEPWVGPDRYSEQDSLLSQLEKIATVEGINCQVAIHAAAEYFGKAIPREDRSGELFDKSEQYRKLDSNEALEQGDILFFHPKDATKDPRSFHVAVYISTDIMGVPWVLHATSQPDKLGPATEVVPMTTVLAGKNANFFGAVRIK